MRIALLTTDSRWLHREFDKEVPGFGMAPEALISGLAALPEVELHIISCTRHPLKSPKQLGPRIYFHSLYVPKIGWMRTLYLGCILATRRRIKEIRPHIVHGQGTELDCALAAAFSGYPNVVTLHGIMREQAQLLNAPVGSFYWLAARLESIALWRTTGTMCNSQYTDDSTRSRTRRIWRVANAVRSEFFQSPIAKRRLDKCILLNVGLVCPRKQQNELLKVVQELRQEGLNLEICFLGKANAATPYGAKFLSAVRQNQSFASYLGFQSVDGIIQRFDRASALIHVPTEESFGLVVAEGLARNLKFFGFRVGGISDIAERVDGVVMVPGGDWDGLKTAIRTWLESGAAVPDVAAIAMREKYHPVVIARRHMEIYSGMLKCAR